MKKNNIMKNIGKYVLRYNLSSKNIFHFRLFEWKSDKYLDITEDFSKSNSFKLYNEQMGLTKFVFKNGEITCSFGRGLPYGLVHKALELGGEKLDYGQVVGEDTKEDTKEGYNHSGIQD